MKLRNLFIAVMTVVIAAASCQKFDRRPDLTDTTKAIFTIADKPSFTDSTSTKAVKTGWATGDQVVFVFKPAGSENWYGTTTSIRAYYTNYDKSTGTWSEMTFTSGVVDDFGETGEFMAIHHRGTILLITDEDKSVTHFTKSSEGNNGVWWKSGDSYPLHGYTGGEIMKGTGTYTVTDGVVTLGTVTLENDPRIFQISVPNLLYESEGNLAMPSQTHKLHMKESKLTIENGAGGYFNVVALKAGKVAFNPATTSYGFVIDIETAATGNAGCVKNGDDISYCFAYKAGATVKPANWEFYVKYQYRVSSSDPETYYIYKLTVPTADKSMAVKKSYRLPSTGWSLTTTNTDPDPS